MITAFIGTLSTVVGTVSTIFAVSTLLVTAGVGTLSTIGGAIGTVFITIAGLIATDGNTLTTILRTIETIFSGAALLIATLFAWHGGSFYSNGAVAAISGAIVAVFLVVALLVTAKILRSWTVTAVYWT